MLDIVVLSGIDLRLILRGDINARNQSYIHFSRKTALKDFPEKLRILISAPSNTRLSNF